MNTFEEPGKNIRLMPECDVLVAGGGPAGVMAAVAAARCGARTRLIESQGALGGIWTGGLLPHVIEHKKNGLLSELRGRLYDENAHTSSWKGDAENSQDYDCEILKCVLDAMCAGAGVDVQFYTLLCAAYRDSSGRKLETVVTESKSGRQAWRARTFIDATGDGDLGAFAGCGFDIGHPQTKQCQPMSMMGMLCGYGTPDVPPFSIADKNEAKDWLLNELRRGGHDPSYSRPTMFLIHDGVISMMANHEYGYRCPDAAVLTGATIRGRAENLEIVRTLRGLGGRWKDLRLLVTSSHIGVRESRRINGLYRITREDLLQGSRFEDAVCRVGFGFDVHALDPESNRGIDRVKGRAQPYDVPLRSMIAADVSGLMTAGRCISGDFYAHSSYRVSGDAAAIGEAAGIASAHAALSGTPVHRLDFADIRDKLPNAPLRNVKD